VRRSELRPGDVLEGPAIVEELDSTTLVLEGQTALVDESTSIVLTEHAASLRSAA